MSRSPADSIPDLEQHYKQKEKEHSISQNEGSSGKGTKDCFCGAANRKSVCDYLRPTLGTSMIVFAVPLLLPGITLTAVAFDDDTSFSKYGALHVIGMILLCMSGLLLLVGIFLNIRFHDKVAPEDVHIHKVSTHEVNLNRQMTVVSMDAKEADAAPAVVASFMVDAGSSSVKHSAHHVTFGASTVGARSLMESPGGGNMTSADSRTNLDFQPSSILHSPKSKDSNTSFMYNQVVSPSHSISDYQNSSTQWYGTSESTDQPKIYETTDDKAYLRNPELKSDDGNKPVSYNIPEITLRAPDNSETGLVASAYTYDATLVNNKDNDSNVEQKLKKKRKKKKKKKHATRLDEHEPGLSQEHDFRPVSFDSKTAFFPAQDNTYFVNIEKTPSALSKTDSSGTVSGTAAYKHITSAQHLYQTDKLSLTQNIYSKTKGYSEDDQTCDDSDKGSDEHSDDIRQSGTNRARLEQHVNDPLPSPSQEDSTQETASHRFASISNSTGTVTQVYAMDAHSSRYVF
ncbi:hypothetical protein PoB_006461300 [Plakobranchus ocellatus]|uniref:Uncharacterized protein n=1 Tax=Plakobranchus ocellatus TaxID=259542 RepID=A0AAV4D231_9GAST|nr:hypothetical protein PoB_006461300 [Plakobranchus ocellatus]